jgi:peptidyl-prolyl cis-trans isomerase B (cyclophilin B)
MPTERQRREAERRRLRRQLERRAQRDARRRRFAVIASVVGTLLVIAIVITFVVATGNDSSDKPAAKSTAHHPAAACSWTTTSNPARSGIAKPPANPPKSGRVSLVVQTTQGSMSFQLDRALAPCTVASFESLVQQKYYDSTPCHRLTTSGIYVLQCGDPTGTGGGGPGYTVPDEATGAETYPAGTLAMARTKDPHSGGSQFFIVYKDSPNLEQHLGKLQYTVFGKVTFGLKVVQKVAAKGTDNSNGQGDGKPKLPITLTNINEVQ